MDLSKVIENIKALCNKTIDKGCTEAEALAAAAKVSELLTNYNLSMDKVFLESTNCVTGKISTNRRRNHPVQLCMVGIAEFCDCKCWKMQHGSNGVEYYFFGLDTDVELAKYLYSVIYSAIEFETTRYKFSPAYTQEIRISRKTLSTSFQKGMSGRIHHRLKELKRQRTKDEYQPICNTSLVVVKQDKVSKEFAKLDMKLKNAQSSNGRVNSSAYYAGYSAADKVNLNRPLGRNNSVISGYLQG